jgi:hypothetical protein
MIQCLDMKFTRASVVTSLALAPCALFLTHLSHLVFFFLQLKWCQLPFLSTLRSTIPDHYYVFPWTEEPLLRLSSQHGTTHARTVIADRQHTCCWVILLILGISLHVNCNRTTDVIITVTAAYSSYTEFLDSNLDPEAGHRYRKWREFSHSL